MATDPVDDRPAIAEVELPPPGQWVSFWRDGKRYTLVADEPGAWTLLRHRTKKATALMSFADRDGGYVALAADGSTVGPAGADWRILAARQL